MDRIKLKPVRRELRKGRQIRIDTNIDATELPNGTPVHIWVSYRPKRGGAPQRSADFIPKKDVIENLRGANVNFTPTKLGVYTVIMAAKIDKKIVTYKGVPVHVVKNA